VGLARQNLQRHIVQRQHARKALGDMLHPEQGLAHAESLTGKSPADGSPIRRDLQAIMRTTGSR
jgi:hypothetical protein